MDFSLPFLCIPKPICCFVPGNPLLSLPPTAGAGLTKGPSPPFFLSRQPGPAGKKLSLSSRIQSAGRAVCPTSPSHLPSYCCQGGTRALTPAPSTERPWQGETLLSPPRWVHMLYRQFCAPGEMLRPPLCLQPGCV